MVGRAVIATEPVIPQGMRARRSSGVFVKGAAFILGAAVWHCSRARSEVE
jgi:hypothetical protein